MRIKKLKSISMMLISLLLIVSFMVSAIGCNPKKENEPDNTVTEEPGQVEIVKKDWKGTEGFWEIKDNIFYQTQADAKGRLAYQNEVEQDYVTISAQVKLMDEEASAGFEFRTQKESETSDPSLTTFSLSAAEGIEMKFPSGSDRYGNGKKAFAAETGKWYTLKLILNGTDASYYVDNTLIEQRTDCAIKSGNKYFALLAEGADTRIKNVQIEQFTPNNLTWDELVDQSDLVKQGYDRFSAVHFEYPYVGFGRTSLLVSSYGFMTPKAQRPSYIGTNYRDDPQFIYDLWWDGAIKVDPFTFSGGYLVDDEMEEGDMLDDGKCSYKQTVDVDTGVLTTELTLKVDGEYVNTKREMIVNEDGVVIMRVTSSTQKQFMFNLTTRDAVFGGLTYDVKQDGYLVKCNLRTDTENQAYVRVKAAGADFTVQNDGTILFDATNQPVYIYLAPESDLTFEEEHDPVANAEKIVTDAANGGFDQALQEAQEWYDEFYSTGRVSIPDLGMAKWYVRSLYYHAVSMAGTRVPPGCYSNNVAGFFGGPCPEFDLSLSQYMLMMTNHTDLAQTTVDWYANTRETLRANAESGYTDKTGHSHEPVEGGYLIPWIAGWDGSPTRGEEVGHEQGWVSMFAGANVASFILNQAEYLNQDMSLAKDIMIGQLRMMMSFFKKIEGKWVHEGVWAGGDTYSAGSFSESMAAVYSLITISEMREEYPELFTASENEEIDEWLLRLPDMPPYNDQFTITYDPDKAMYTIGHTTAEIPEMITEGTGYVGGPTNNVYFWYHLLPYDDENLPGTLVSIAESGQFDYHFNTGWSATVAARAGMADFAFQYARYMLRPSSLYDDWYLTENVNDSEDFKRSPELGSHGAFVMSISAMMFDGETDEYIKAFPAITQQWQAIGVDFTKMLAKGNIEVSGTYTNESTSVTLENKSSEDAVRDIYVRVKEGSGAAMFNGKEYDIVDGCMALIPDVKIKAGETLVIKVSGIEKECNIESFDGLSPVAGSDRVRTENVPFSWTGTDHASSYRLVVSKYSDLTTPLFDMNVGLTTLYYPLDTQMQIDLDEGTTYYWTVFAIHGEQERQMSQGIMSFTTKGGGAEPVDPLPDGTKVEAFGKTWDVNQYAIEVDGGINVTSIVGHQENDPTGAYFVTDKDFTVTVTVEMGSLGKAGIEIWSNSSYQFVRTEDGRISSYGNLAPGGMSPDDGPEATEKVTYRLSRIDGVLTTYYKLDGQTEFTKIMEGELPPALNGQNIRVYLCAISSYYDQNTQIMARFTDYSEEFYEPGEPEEPGEEIPAGEAVSAGQKVTLNGVELTASDGAKVVKDTQGNAESVVVSSMEGRTDADPTGFYFDVQQNFVFTAKFRTNDLGRSGLMLRDPEGKYMFIRSEGGVISSYGSMQDGCGSGNAGNISGWIYFRLAMENGILYTAYSSDGQSFTKVVNDIKLSYASGTVFKLWLFASQDVAGGATLAAQFTELTLTESEYQEPEQGIPAGSTVDVFGTEFTAASEILKKDGTYRVIGAGMPDNNPAGMYVSLTGDFTITAKVNLQLEGAVAGLTFMNSNGNYMFIRSSAAYLLESYGNLNTGASGVGGTDVGYSGGEIYFKAQRVGNTVKTYYSLDGTEFIEFSQLVIDEANIASSQTLKMYFSVSGGGVSSYMDILSFEKSA